MKLIATLYTTSELEVTLTVQARTSRNETIPADSKRNDALVVRHVSRIGNMSLIFNPSIYLQLRPRSYGSQAGATIPSTIIHRFSGSLSRVYKSLSTEKLFREEGSTLYVDSKQAQNHSRKLSLYRNSLLMVPAVVDNYGQIVRGVSFSVDGETLGSMAHSDVLNLIDLLDHFDLPTYTLLAGVVDELATMNGKLDTILDMLRRMEHGGNAKAAPRDAAADMLAQFNWTAVGGGGGVMGMP